MQWAGPGGLWRGLGAPLRAARFLGRRPRLWWLCAAPFLINSILFYFAYRIGLERINQWLEGLIPLGQGWLWTALYWLVWAAVIVFLAAAGVYMFTAVGRIIAAPFLDLLTYRVEAEVSGTRPPDSRYGILGEMLRVARQETVKLLLYAVVMLLLFLLSILVPLVGGVSSALLGWLVTCYFLALEFLDYPLERRGLGLRQKMAATWRTTPAWLGLGASIFVLGVIPVINLALLPLAAVGGVLLYVEEMPAPPPVPHVAP